MIQFFKILRCYIDKLKSIVLSRVRKNVNSEKETVDFFKKNLVQLIKGFTLVSLVWGFAGSLDLKNRKIFE